MPQASPHAPARPLPTPRVKPSIVDPATAKPFTLEQELLPFGEWVGDPIWAPPMGSSRSLAQSILEDSWPFTSNEKRWATLIEKHRSEFTQVREMELQEASIRLPKGRFYVSVTEREDFDKIEEEVPACVQTRLEEFLEGPGQKWGVKVYYLKPLCVEVGDDLIMTSRQDLMAAIQKIQDEVFEKCQELAFVERSVQAMTSVVNLALAVPNRIVQHYVERRQKAVDEYHARIEFKRRKTALSAARTYRKCRTDGCTFDEMLALTNPLDRRDVVEQYGVEKKLSRAKRDQLLMITAGTLPWFVALSLGITHLASLSLAAAPPVAMCDPAFVAVLPGAPGVLYKIGHFDEVGGVMHIEI